jgi:hypothetical protein
MWLHNTCYKMLHNLDYVTTCNILLYESVPFLVGMPLASLPNVLAFLLWDFWAFVHAIVTKTKRMLKSATQKHVMFEVLVVCILVTIVMLPSVLHRVGPVPRHDAWHLSRLA